MIHKQIQSIKEQPYTKSSNNKQKMFHVKHFYLNLEIVFTFYRQSFIIITNGNNWNN